MGSTCCVGQAVVGATLYEVEETQSGTEEPVLIPLRRTQPVPSTSMSGSPENIPTWVRACNDYACGEWSNEQVLVITPPVPADSPCCMPS